MRGIAVAAQRIRLPTVSDYPPLYVKGWEVGCSLKEGECQETGTRLPSRLDYPPDTLTHRVAVKNRQKNGMFRTFSFATQRISLVSQIGEQDSILRKKLHISYTDQFVVPPIFNYLIGAKDVEHIRLA